MNDDLIDELLKTVKSIAVVGYSDKPGRAGHYVPEYLEGHGYRIFGVSPTAQGASASLAEVPEPVDMVLLFRKSEDIPQHLPEILAMRPRPRAVWMQLGIRNQEVADALEREGFRVVQDACMKVEHASRKG